MLSLSVSLDSLCQAKPSQVGTLRRLTWAGNISGPVSTTLVSNQAMLSIRTTWSSTLHAEKDRVLSQFNLSISSLKPLLDRSAEDYLVDHVDVNNLE